MHRSACETSRSMNAHDAEHEGEAEEGAATEGNKKAPINQRMTRFLCNRDDQQRRHCDVIGEMNQCVRQRPRHIAGIATIPAGRIHANTGRIRSAICTEDVSDRLSNSCMESEVRSIALGVKFCSADL